MSQDSAEIDLEELAKFNLESVQAYGSGRINIEKDADGRRRYSIQNDVFRLTDEFDGGNPFCGIVRIIRKLDNSVVWNSYYHGWITDAAAKQGVSDQTVFNFMRSAMRHADRHTITRGPAVYKDDTQHLTYKNMLESGDITCFYGNDAIYYGSEASPLYVCRYGGGLVDLTEDAGEALPGQFTE